MTSPDEPQNPSVAGEPSVDAEGAAPTFSTPAPAVPSTPSDPSPYAPPPPPYGPTAGQPPVYEIPGQPTEWAPQPMAMAMAAPKRSKLPVIIAALVAMLLVAGGVGGYVAYRALSGGGTQPEAAVAADAFAFVDVDLNPSASQKVNAYDFMHKLPKVGSAFEVRTDLKKSVFDAIAALGGIGSDITYEHDIKPWLGNRLGVAVRPAAIHGDSPDVVVLIQCTDEAKARSSIQKIANRAGNGSSVAIGFSEGYAVLSKTQATVDRDIADAKKANLKKSGTFSADMKSMGDSGISSGWVDLGGIVKALPNSVTQGSNLNSMLSKLSVDKARIAYALRFIDGGVELVAKTLGAKGGTDFTPTNGFPTIGDLPADTAAAVRVAGLDKTLDSAWSGLHGAMDNAFPGGANPLDQLQGQFGLRLPDDAKTLVGSDLIAALSSKGLPDSPSFGVRSHTDGTAADKVLTTLKHAGAPLPGWKILGDGFVLATSEEYANMLASPSGPKLSDSAGFKKALPNAGSAGLELYVNVRAIADQIKDPSMSADARKALNAFDSVGVSLAQHGDSASFDLRVITR